MKSKLFLFAALIFMLSSCSTNSDKKNSTEINSVASSDSIEIDGTFHLTHPDPPYADYDTVIPMKFASQKEFEEWKTKNPNEKFIIKTNKK